MATATLQVRKLAQSQLTALRRRAQRDGSTPEEYVRHLIQDDLEADVRTRAVSFAELCKPFREAFKGVPESEIDALVDAAKKRRRKQRSKRRR